MIRCRIDKMERRFLDFFHPFRRFLQKDMVIDTDPGPRSFRTTKVSSTFNAVKALRFAKVIEVTIRSITAIPVNSLIT